MREQSVVNIFQVFTVNKGDLMEKVGSLDVERIREVISGVNLLLEPRWTEGVINE